VIALHSPGGVVETGLPMCHPEKRQDGDRLRCRAVRSLQSALSGKYREKWACFACFGVRCGGISLQFRLRGGESGIRTFVTFCIRRLRADVCATYNGFCNMYVSSGELLEHPNPAEQSLFLFRTKGERPAIIGLKVASLETLSAANS
jgi:hypothetical protein